jgi:hypothetical protein
LRCACKHIVVVSIITSNVNLIVPEFSGCTGLELDWFFQEYGNKRNKKSFVREDGG